MDLLAELRRKLKPPREPRKGETESLRIDDILIWADSSCEATRKHYAPGDIQRDADVLRSTLGSASRESRK